MIVEKEKINVKKSNGLEQSSFRINTESDHLFHILSNLYTDPLGSVVREISTNCLDAHKMVDNDHIPFDIYLPNNLNEQRLGFRDYGPGMTDSEVNSIYQEYGRSTKTTSNKMTGYLGLGSKSPFAITNSFVVTSNVNRGFDKHPGNFVNIVESANLYKNFNFSKAKWDSCKTTYYNSIKGSDGVPQMIEMGFAYTRNDTGMLIEIPISSSLRPRLQESIKKQLAFFKIKPNCDVNFDNFDDKHFYKISHNIQTWNRKNSSMPSHLQLRENKLIQGEVAYDLNLKVLAESIETSLSKNHTDIVPFIKKLIEYSDSIGLFIFAEMGKITFHPSREYLIFDNKTISYIVYELEKIKESMTHFYIRGFQKYMADEGYAPGININSFLSILKENRHRQPAISDQMILKTSLSYNLLDCRKIPELNITNNKEFKKIQLSDFLSSTYRYKLSKSVIKRNQKLVSMGISWEKRGHNKDNDNIVHETAWMLNKRERMFKINNLRKIVKKRKDNNISKDLVRHSIDIETNYNIHKVKHYNGGLASCSADYIPSKNALVVVCRKNSIQNIKWYASKLQDISSNRKKTIYFIHLDKGNINSFKKLAYNVSDTRFNNFQIITIDELKSIFNTKIKNLRKSQREETKIKQSKKIEGIKHKSGWFIENNKSKTVRISSLFDEETNTIDTSKMYYLYVTDFIKKDNRFRSSKLKHIHYNSYTFQNILIQLGEAGLINLNGLSFFEIMDKKEVKIFEEDGIQSIETLFTEDILKKISGFLYKSDLIVGNRHLKVDSFYLESAEFFEHVINNIIKTNTYNVGQLKDNTTASEIKKLCSNTIGTEMMKIFKIKSFLTKDKIKLHYMTESIVNALSQEAYKPQNFKEIDISLNMNFATISYWPLIEKNTFFFLNSKGKQDAIEYIKGNRALFSLNSYKQSIINEIQNERKSRIKHPKTILKELAFVENLYNYKKKEIEEHFTNTIQKNIDKQTQNRLDLEEKDRIISMKKEILKQSLLLWKNNITDEELKKESSDLEIRNIPTNSLHVRNFFRYH